MLSSSLFEYVLISSSFYFYSMMVLSWAARGFGPGGPRGRAGRPGGPGRSFFKQPPKVACLVLGPNSPKGACLVLGPIS